MHFNSIVAFEDIEFAAVCDIKEKRAVVALKNMAAEFGMLIGNIYFKLYVVDEYIRRTNTQVYYQGFILRGNSDGYQ